MVHAQTLRHWLPTHSPWLRHLSIKHSALLSHIFHLKFQQLISGFASMRTTSVVVHIRTVSLYEAVSTTSDDTLEADFDHIFDIQPVGKESQKRPQHYVQMYFIIAQEKCTWRLSDLDVHLCKPEYLRWWVFDRGLGSGGCISDVLDYLSLLWNARTMNVICWAS